MEIKNFTLNDCRAIALFLANPSLAIGGEVEIGERLYGTVVSRTGTPRKRNRSGLLGRAAMKRLEAHGLVGEITIDPGTPRKWGLTPQGFERLRQLFPPLPETTEPPFDCLTCGACCSYFAVVSLEAFSNEPGLGIDLQDYDDYSKLPPAMLAFEPMPEGSRLPPNVVLRTRQVGEWFQCVGLEGRVGEPCRCSVYEARPLTCSDFEVGGLKCLKSREARGLSIEGALFPVDG